MVSSVRLMYLANSARPPSYLNELELMIRGTSIFLRFLQGGWKHVKV